MKLFLFFIMIILFASCGSQNPTIRNNIKKNAIDNLSAGIENYKIGNLDSSKLFLKEALKEAYSIDNMDSIILILQSLSEVNLECEDYASASNYIFQAENLAESDNNKNYDFIIQKTIGKYFEKTASSADNFEKAYKYYIKASQSTKKDEEKAIAYNNIGTVEIKMNKLDEAMEWLVKAKNINESKKIYNSLADNYFNIGDIFSKKGILAASLTNYNLALTNDKISEHLNGIIEDLKRIASIYNKMGDKDTSLRFYSRALNAALSMNNIKEAENISNLIAGQK